jgi:hypothetical protein
MDTWSAQQQKESVLTGILRGKNTDGRYQNPSLPLRTRPPSEPHHVIVTSVVSHVYIITKYVNYSNFRVR